MTNRSNISRRDFFKVFPISVMGIGLGSIKRNGTENSYVIDGNKRIKPEYRNVIPGMKYRIFGRTGLMLSELGIGGVGAVGSMYRPLIDAGLNYVQYYGDNELPNILKDRRLRGRLFIIGQPYLDLGKMEKKHFESPQKIFNLVDGLLKKLNIEQIDILNVHIAGYGFLPDYILETKERLIEAGKIRFLTSSYHNLIPLSDPEGTIAEFSKIYDGFLGGFNFLQGKTFPLQLFDKYKIGVITFKPMQGLQWSSLLKERARKEGIVIQETAVRWLLSIPEISSVVRLIANRAQLESNLRAMKAGLSNTEKRYLQSAALAMGDSTCDLCGKCSDACPNGVAVADIQRCRLYAEGFYDSDRALNLYHSLGREHSLQACCGCGSCEHACPKNLAIRKSMAFVHNALVP